MATETNNSNFINLKMYLVSHSYTVKTKSNYEMKSLVGSISLAGGINQ